MSVSEAKRKILEALWEAEKPLRLKELAEITGLGTASLNMHLLGMKKTGHVSTPESGRFSLTEKGRVALGIPKLDSVKAREILSKVAVEKAFHFYTGIHQYLGIYASGLAEFCDILRRIDPRSVEFHLQRRDFERWFLGLGDVELAKRMHTLMIRRAGVSGEKLREEVYQTVKSRCAELERVSQATR